MKTTNIYILIDPRNNKVRYVGKANNINQRFKAHLNNARKHQIHKKNWIDSLKKQNLKPIIDIIDIVPINDWIFWETYWICQFKTWGFDLINYTNGGDGCTFSNQTSFKIGERCKSVVGLNKNGELVFEFKSGTEVLNKLKINIGHALKSERRMAGNYIWLYKEEYEKMTSNDLSEIIHNANQEMKRTRGQNINLFKIGFIPWNKGKGGYRNLNSANRKIVLQYDLNDNFIMEHKSIRDAAYTIKGSEDAISACLNGRSKKSCGFKWKLKK